MFTLRPFHSMIETTNGYTEDERLHQPRTSTRRGMRVPEDILQVELLLMTPGLQRFNEVRYTRGLSHVRAEHSLHHVTRPSKPNLFSKEMRTLASCKNPSRPSESDPK